VIIGPAQKVRFAVKISPDHLLLTDFVSIFPEAFYILKNDSLFFSFVEEYDPTIGKQLAGKPNSNC
jgi:hypothetical protein